MAEHNRRVRIGTRALDMVVPEGHVWVADHVAILDVPGEHLRIEPAPYGFFELMTYADYARRVPNADVQNAEAGNLVLHLHNAMLIQDEVRPITTR